MNEVEHAYHHGYDHEPRPEHRHVAGLLAVARHAAYDPDRWRGAAQYPAVPPDLYRFYPDGSVTLVDSGPLPLVDVR